MVVVVVGAAAAVGVCVCVCLGVCLFVRACVCVCVCARARVRRLGVVAEGHVLAERERGPRVEHVVDVLPHRVHLRAGQRTGYLEQGQ